jgi:hypothetical protein
MRGRKKRRAEAASAQAEAQAAQTGPSALSVAAKGPEAASAKPGKPPKAKKAARAKRLQPKPKPKRRPHGPARQTRLTRLVGLAFCIGGFVAIGFGWSGAASKDCVACQMPYLLSGGAAGMGLIVFGTGMMVMAQLRTEGRRLADRLGQVQSSGLPPDAAPPARNGSLPSSAMVEGKPSAPETGEPSPGPGPPPVTTPAGSG